MWTKKKGRERSSAKKSTEKEQVLDQRIDKCMVLLWMVCLRLTKAAEEFDMQKTIVYVEADLEEVQQGHQSHNLKIMCFI